MAVKTFSSNKELMNYLKDYGSIKSDFVYGIMCSVDRKHFMNYTLPSYTDRPQRVAYDKTISAPHMHAKVLEYLSDKLRNGGRILDVGSGSGYLTTCMAMAFQKPGVVTGMDCIPGFQDMAQKIVQNNYQELFLRNRIEFVVGDGRHGYPIRSPYNIIHVGLSATDVPQSLLDQLAPGGCLIMPIGDQSAQTLCLVNKSLTGVIERKQLCRVRYGCFDDVKDMSIYISNLAENQCSSMSDKNLKDNSESFENEVKNKAEILEKKINAFQTALTEKIDSIILKFNKKCEKISEEVLGKINNVEVCLKNVESEIKVFKIEMQTKFKEYHDHLSAKYEKIEQEIHALSDKIQQSKENSENRVRKVHSDNLTGIKEIYAKLVKLLEDQKIQIQETNIKWNEINQQLQKETFEKNNFFVNNRNAYESLERKLNTLSEQLMGQNAKIDIYKKILEIQVNILIKEKARREAEKKVKKLKLEKLTKTFTELSKEIILMASELESELKRKSFTKKKNKNDTANFSYELLKH